MRKVHILPLILALVAGLVLMNGTQPVFAAEKGKYGGILKINHAKAAGRFGFPLNVRHWDHEYTDFACQTMMRPDPENIGAYQPILATSWELAPDKSYYIFHLRKGVKFHDGTDFNAQAAKWNLDFWVRSKRPTLDKVTSIEVIDDYTIKCHLSSWDSVLIDDFSRQTYMISPTAYKKHGEKWADTHPVGTGAFKLTEFRRQSHLKYEKFEDYWETKNGDKLPYLDGIHITQIGDPMTAIAALKKGEVDSMMGIDVVTANELKATGDYKLQWIPGLSHVVVMNSMNPESVWSDKRMRAALELAIDKETICKSLGYGFVKPFYEIIKYCPGNPGKTIRKYDPEKAKQLMKEAGHAQGVKVKLTFQAEQNRDFYVALQENLASVGIQLDLTPVRGAALHKMSFEPAPGNDLRVEPQRGGPTAVLVGVKETLSSNSVYFPGLKRPAGFDELLNQALAETEWNKIVKLLEQMEERAYNGAMFVPLWNGPLISIHRKFIKDAYFMWAQIPYPHMEYAWLDKK
ncbi:MAG: ABC transporter substrate-binding protein [Deltaproteobacteria bacterium]|nr:ABC transporter substrate-binding protein [Deltaproteobacteria bacterium]